MPDPVTGTIAAVTVGSSLIGSSASRGAAASQERAAAQASDTQRAIFERQVELQEPFRQAGINALTKLQEQQGGMPEAFSSSMVRTEQDPGYAFRMSEGMKALERSAAARGGLLSGATLKGAQRYGQDLASQEYQNAFNRALTEYNARVARESTGYNRLASLANVGQTATSQITGAAGTLGSQLGSNIIGAGNAAAAGQIGSANAIVGGLGQGINFYQNQQLMNRLYPVRGGGSFGGGGFRTTGEDFSMMAEPGYSNLY
jgi:hypothetical protein